MVGVFFFFYFLLSENLDLVFSTADLEAFRCVCFYYFSNLFFWGIECDVGFNVNLLFWALE